MKKVLIILLVLCCVMIPDVYAQEMLSNGWYVLPASDAKASDSFNNQNKVWAQYVNGVETKRYSALLGIHRGYGDAPENSLAAYRSVKDHGYYGFETDVRFTKDNVAVLCHDAYINNLAVDNNLKSLGSNKIYVKDLTYSQLKNNYIFNIQRLNGSKKLSNYNSNRISTLEEMFNFIKENNMFVSIELKEGTSEQIASIVKMADSKGVHNNVRWISYYVNLLEYVKNTDNDEKLGVLVGSAGNCSGNNNRYCSGDGSSKAESIFKRVKTDNNMVWFENYTSRYKLPGTGFGYNLPSSKSEFDSKISSYTLKTIPQGKITVNNNSISINNSEKKEIDYSYTGDGTVKCSGDSDKVNCNVDSSRKKIVLSSKTNTNTTASVNVYATQGIAYSATTDTKINVTINTNSVPNNTTPSSNDATPTNNVVVRNINVSGYDLGFKESVYDYKLKIKDQNRLDIVVDIANKNYDYKIVGNDNLQNGSVISINLYNGYTIVHIYKITIEKDANATPNREISPVVSSSSTSNNGTNSTTTVTTTTNLYSSSNSTTTSNENTSNSSTSNNTTVGVMKAPTKTTSNVTAQEVNVPNTDQYMDMIYYIIALSLFIGAYYVIKNGIKTYKNYN